VGNVTKVIAETTADREHQQLSAIEPDTTAAGMKCAPVQSKAASVPPTLRNSTETVDIVDLLRARALQHAPKIMRPVDWRQPAYSAK
jgi:hypothetical protein